MTSWTEGPARRSAFDVLLDAAGDRVGPARLRQATLADVTHTFEDLLEEFQLGGILLAGFQRGAQWEAERERYAALAAAADRTVAVVSTQPLLEVEGVQIYTVPADHPLADHWFLVALTPMVSATLFARELPGSPSDGGGERPFDAVWTFDPTVAADACRVVRELAVDGAPGLTEFVAGAVARMPPSPMTHAFGQRYSVATFERLEATRRRWRNLSVQLGDARRELEERSERQLKLERLASVGTLAASVAHELNNPLASITMAANLMGQLEDPDERIRLAGIIEAEALRAGRIASDLLSYVADRELELTTTRLDEWLDEFARGYLRAGKPVRFRPAAATTAEVDHDRLRQVLGNLVDNALDAIPVDGHVELDLELTDTDVVIGVTDDGGGIPERIRPRLFDPFVTSKPRGKGTGLGLPIARAHLQDHGGELELVRSGPEGTRFEVRLSRDGVADGSLEEGPELMAGPITPAKLRRGGRVLVVDDEPPIRSLLDTLLRRSGWRVVAAAGLHDAVQALQQEPVDLALIDVQLGATDGPTVLAELERLQPGLRERTAYVTGAPPEAGRIDGRPVLGKPFSWTELSELLDRLEQS